MGAGGSRLALSNITREDIAAHVAALEGDDYKPYATLVLDNGVDGDYLSEIKADEFLETLDDLNITNSAHRIKLLGEFQKYSSQELSVVTEDAQQLQKSNNSHTTTTKRSDNNQHDPKDGVLRPGQGPVREVRVSQISSSSGPRDFPSPEELASTNTVRDSSKLAAFSQGRANNESQSSHLSPDFYQKIDTVGAPRPPISANDMDRVAQMESYGLEEIEPDSDIAKALMGFVEMAMKLFNFDMADITFLNNESMFSMARVGMLEPMNEAVKNDVYQIMNYAADGSSFLCKTDRSIGICNYPHFSKRTFVVHDIHQDETFKWLEGGWPFRCYVGSPLLTASGVVLGTLCLHNLEPRPDFDRACEIQAEQVATMIVQSIENWRLRRNITRLETTRLALQSNDNKHKPPEGNSVVIVMTGMDSSMALFESKPKAMKRALALHNDLVRKLRAEHFGYEVSTDGDGFFLAFHDAVDAFGFALNLQKSLYSADWPLDILDCPEACDDGNAFRGLRVKVAVHTGATKAEKNAASGRMEYKGKVVSTTKHILSMAHGGQILTTFDTWNVASFLAESKLDSPQVVDLGSHVVRKGKKTHHGVISERILQLVPNSLAVRYSDLAKTVEIAENGTPNKTHISGRQFPPIQSLKKLSASFFDAPAFNSGDPEPKVTIAFIGLSQIEKRYKDAAGIISEIIGLANSALAGTKGYQCQNNMLAFPNNTEAAKFGLSFRELLGEQQPLEDGADAASLITFGCVHDSFVTLEPHKTTGRADYFGKVVNRAARVAYSSRLGSVSVGVVITPGFDQETFGAGIDDPTIDSEFVGNRKLKGVEGEMAVFECSRRSNSPPQ